MPNNARHGGARPGAGRKTIEPDLIELEKLCSLLCTHGDLAKFFGVSERTVEKWENIPTYAEVMDRGRARGLISIRRIQMQLLNAGNVAMAIHLGKTVLGQREVTPIELNGSQDKPLKLSLEVLDEIQKLARKNK